MPFALPNLQHVFANPLVLVLTVYMVVLVIVACILVVVTLHLHQKNQRTAKKWAEMEQRWQPLLLKTLGGEMWPEELRAQIYPGEGFYFIDYLTRYAEKLSGESRQRATDLASPYLPQLLKRVKQGDAEQRARAILTLSILAPEGHQNRMVEALEDESPLVSTMAARALAENGSIAHLAPILEKMPRFRSWSQNYLVSMLVSLAKDHPEKLRDALVLSHQPDWVKTVILKALTEIKDWQTLPLAVQFLQEDAHREVQAASLQFLARIGHEGLLDLIRKKCRSEDFVIRLNAVKALSNLGSAEDRELLLHLLEDPSQWIAHQAAQALKSTKHFEDLLAIALSDHPRAELAKEVLYDLESTESVAFLSKTEHFMELAPQWLRKVKRKDTRDQWRQVEKLLLHPKTPQAVKQLIAQHLDTQSPTWLFNTLEKEFLETRHHPTTSLVTALYRLQPNAAVLRFQENFFLIENAEVQAQVFQYIQRKARPEFLGFYKELQNTLRQAPQTLALSSHQQQDIKPQVEQLIHKSLLGEGRTQQLSGDL